MSWEIICYKGVPDYLKEASACFACVFGLWGWEIHLRLSDDPGRDGSRSSYGSCKTWGDGLHVTIEIDREHAENGKKAEVLETLLHEFLHLAIADLDRDARCGLSDELYAAFKRTNERTVCRLTMGMKSMIPHILKTYRK